LDSLSVRVDDPLAGEKDSQKKESVGIASRRSPLRRGAPVEASPEQRRRQQRCGEQWHSNGSGKGILATTAWHSFFFLSIYFFIVEKKTTHHV